MKTDHVILREKNGDLDALSAAERSFEGFELALFQAMFIGALAARTSAAAWQEAINSSLEAVADRRRRELNARLKASIALEDGKAVAQ